MTDLERLRRIFTRIFPMHRNIKRTIDNEWKAIIQEDTNISAKQASALIQNRLLFLHRISLLKFKDPVHVCGTLRHFRHFPSYEEARAAYVGACDEHRVIFDHESTGNIVLNTEISFADYGEKQDYEIHCHVIMEKEEYENFKSNTKAWRQGKFKAEKYFDTRAAKRTYSNQSNKDYVTRLGNYFAKFGLYEGDTRISKTNGKAAKAYKNQCRDMADYAIMHYEYGLYIRSANMRYGFNKKFLDLYFKVLALWRRFRHNSIIDKFKAILDIKKQKDEEKQKRFWDYFNWKKPKIINDFTYNSAAFHTIKNKSTTFHNQISDSS